MKFFCKRKFKIHIKQTQQKKSFEIKVTPLRERDVRARRVNLLKNFQEKHVNTHDQTSNTQVEIVGAIEKKPKPPKSHSATFTVGCREPQAAGVWGW